MSEQNNQNKDKVRIDFPPKWVTAEKANGEPYTISNGKGDSWPAVKCTLPTGTKVDGKDLSGFNFTAFQKPWNKADIEAGKGTGVFVNADRNVSLFKYDRDGQRHDESVEPQKLSDAVEAAREEYRAQHQSHDRSQEQETGLDELCEQKTAEASERIDVDKSAHEFGHKCIENACAQGIAIASRQAEMPAGGRVSAVEIDIDGSTLGLEPTKDGLERSLDDLCDEKQAEADLTEGDKDRETRFESKETWR